MIYPSFDFSLEIESNFQWIFKIWNCGQKWKIHFNNFSWLLHLSTYTCTLNQSILRSILTSAVARKFFAQHRFCCLKNLSLFFHSWNFRSLLINLGADLTSILTPIFSSFIFYLLFCMSFTRISNWPTTVRPEKNWCTLLIQFLYHILSFFSIFVQVRYFVRLAKNENNNQRKENTQCFSTFQHRSHSISNDPINLNDFILLTFAEMISPLPYTLSVTCVVWIYFFYFFKITRSIKPRIFELAVSYLTWLQSFVCTTILSDKNGTWNSLRLSLWICFQFNYLFIMIIIIQFSLFNCIVVGVQSMAQSYAYSLQSESM